jgi:predicted XRE-type DNA-binding protein
MTARIGRKRTPPHERGSANVYRDLGFTDPEAMLVKAQLTSKISEILSGRRYTQMKAAELLGIPQPKLSQILRGNFRGVSERKLMDCLVKLGRDVEIVVRDAPRDRRAGMRGTVSVVFA